MNGHFIEYGNLAIVANQLDQLLYRSLHPDIPYNPV